MLKSARQSKPPATPSAPVLTAKTPLEEFRNHYWYLSDLARFCRENGLPAAGQKHELMTRVEHFLRTGTRPEKIRSGSAKNTAARVGDNGPITLETVVTDDYKSDEKTRSFFKSVIGPHFHFSARVNQFRHEQRRKGIRTTYGDLVKEWLAERNDRKKANFKSPIAGSWQYNQFVRDFMGDKARNTGKGMKDAARAWKLIRDHEGPHTYAEHVRAGLERSGRSER